MVPRNAASAEPTSPGPAAPGALRLEVRLNASDVEAYQLAIFNLEKDSPLLIEADFLEEDDLEEFDRSGASPPLAISDGNARLPWFGIAFEGRHKFLIYALDKNWYDFVRTDPDSDGGEGGISVESSGRHDTVTVSIAAAALVHKLQPWRTV